MNLRQIDTLIRKYVSDTFDVNSILSRMLESLNPTRVGITSQDALLKNLQENLKGKIYILILDDVWNEHPQKWSNLMSCLTNLDSAQGSNIIVTIPNS